MIIISPWREWWNIAEAFDSHFWTRVHNVRFLSYNFHRNSLIIFCIQGDFVIQTNIKYFWKSRPSSTEWILKVSILILNWYEASSLCAFHLGLLISLINNKNKLYFFSCYMYENKNYSPTIHSHNWDLRRAKESWASEDFLEKDFPSKEACLAFRGCCLVHSARKKIRGECMWVTKMSETSTLL